MDCADIRVLFGCVAANIDDYRLESAMRRNGVHAETQAVSVGCRAGAQLGEFDIEFERIASVVPS